MMHIVFFFFSSRRRHTRLTCDWSSDVCSSDLADRLQIDSRRFDPQAELHAGVVREIGERAQAARKPFRILVPVAEAGLEIERAVASGASIPTSVEHEELDA